MSPETGILTLERYPEYLGCTPGRFRFGRQDVGYALELPWRDNKEDVSCIPLGEYALEITPSPKFFGRLVVEIMDVPDRTGVRMHPANWVEQLLGCIAPATELSIRGQKLMANASTPVYANIYKQVTEGTMKRLRIIPLAQR